MNIGIIGYGKMGKMIEKLAKSRNHTIGAIIDEPNWNPKKISGLDVVIDFTNPQSAVQNIENCFEENVPIVVGTTGWYKDYDHIIKLCQDKKGTLFTATNFSIGVNIFWHINKVLANVMNQYNDYNTTINEVHHTEKLDSPSGTAISTAEILIKELDRYSMWIEGKQNNQETIAIHASRKKNVPGTHVVKYENDIDEITFSHQAKNRNGFALGAILAAEFLKGKTGVYNMNDLIKF